MTDHAVNIILIVKVEGLILPAITGMALRAHALIATRVSTEGIDQMFFTQGLASFFIFVSPCPVYVFHKLLTGLVMTLQTGPGDLGATQKGCLQFFKFAMVSGGIRIGTQGRFFYKRIQPVVHVSICFSSCFICSLGVECKQKQQQPGDKAQGISHRYPPIEDDHGFFSIPQTKLDSQFLYALIQIVNCRVYNNICGSVSMINIKPWGKKQREQLLAGRCYSLRIGIIYNDQTGYRLGSVFHVCSSCVCNVKREHNGFNGPSFEVAFAFVSSSSHAPG